MSEKNSNHVKERNRRHLKNAPTLAGGNCAKVGGKILENSKQFSRVTTSPDSHGIAKHFNVDVTSTCCSQ